MKTISRSMDGRIQGSIAYWLNSHEDESYRDVKVKPDAMLFPNSHESVIYPVTTYRLEDLK
jgi:hypothetical protein